MAQRMMIVESYAGYRLPNLVLEQYCGLINSFPLISPPPPPLLPRYSSMFSFFRKPEAVIIQSLKMFGVGAKEQTAFGYDAKLLIDKVLEFLSANFNAGPNQFYYITGPYT